MLATVVYDGACGFCSRSAAWARKRDRGGLVFTPATAARDELERRGLTQRAAQTVLLLTRKRCYGQSSAVVRVLWRLRGGWPVVGAALWLVPKPLRDWGYRRVAHKWGPLGKRG